MDLIKELNKEALQKETANVQVGDTVRVHVRVKEGSRERIQVFEGTVIAKKHGGIEETVTVRRVSYGIGVEKVFPVHSPSIDHFEVVRNGKVRRAKLRHPWNGRCREPCCMQLPEKQRSGRASWSWRSLPPERRSEKQPFPCWACRKRC